MKRLFYIFHDKLGENIFATPCLELLNKEYEIFVLMKEWMIPFFKDYSFINKIIPIENYQEHKATFQQKEAWYAYHNDKQSKFFENKFSNIKPYEVISDKDLNLFGPFCNSNRILSRTRQYMLKLRLLSLEEMEKYDCKIRVPVYHKEPSEERVVVYQGSRDISRRLSDNMLLKFLTKFPDAVYLIQQSSEEVVKKAKAKYIVIDPITNETYQKLVKLFSSNVRCMIGPDSALTQLALGYNIPQIWLQTRIKIEQVIDPQYKSLCKIYSKNNLTCDKKCIGCAFYKSVFGGLYEFETEIIRHENLKCIKNKDFSCMQYDQNDINKIGSIIDDI